MKILWVFAHPERRSLNGSLMAAGLAELAERGHDVRVSDLYAMGWKPVVDAADFPGAGGLERDRLVVGAAQERGHRERRLSPDVLAEQERIDWADAIVLHFPLWWFGPPAILKGWLDRVLVQGFAFGLRDDQGRTRRYGDGGLVGKRALIVTSVGAREASFGPRGIHGHVDEVLFPLLHGTFWYTGAAALPPFVVYGADRADAAAADAAAKGLRARLAELPTQRPIAYRYENSADYDADLVLRPDLAPGRTGLGVHRWDGPHACAAAPGTGAAAQAD
ncbi:NAD(P)H-dependent oxidoreductase [Streptomonospora nanhaiensis]|uniref:NAD(P)H dehydrogenase (Quinone) n=1 Tax=Streptomonospora nanhaiensis TaxID=1323731 RepID=A0A853BP31_9ACTN|nr:NAD(P)H-dependent oxidoreductase [Streptomonospora nanhaiensis]MBV2365738.1 NAD(P)H-dependent oxidoreductase [Streptomonospora nanhaiensis]MBX9391717.1 NAD(P)H-dependent oxidoreductase [Streptomonospora nanhaiensis]NYI96534.1 NAD(P)H dehydrogenase (quinone) [Streptomonospora nanhaiensis]